MIGRGVQCRPGGLLEGQPASTDKGAESGEQRPEETLSTVPERVGVIGGPDAAEHADEQEHLDGYLGRVGRRLSAQGH